MSLLRTNREFQEQGEAALDEKMGTKETFEKAISCDGQARPINS